MVPDAGNTLIPQHGHSMRAPIIQRLLQGPRSVRWRADGDVSTGPTEYCAPATIRIPAHIMHSFLTLEPETVLACIHNADHLEADEPAVAERHDLEFEEN